MSETSRSAAFVGIDAVILDFDGVIVDSETISLGELQASLLEFGIEMDWPTLVKTFLGSNPGAIADYMRETTGRDPEAVFPGPWHQRVIAGFENDLALIEGADHLLDQLDHMGIAYCLASGSSVERLAFALEKVGLSKRFKGRAFSTELVEQGKPEPDIFHYACDALNVRPDRCMVIEDGTAGTIGARAAGIPSVVGFLGGTHLSDDELRQRHGAALTASGANKVIEAFAELFD